MSATATKPSMAPVKPPYSRRKPLALVSCCTVMGAAAQLLIKIGMTQFSPHPWAIVTNVPLVVGYALYGINTVLLVLALREGELSLLYPVIALTYVWVTLLSYALLHEPASAFKNAGIAAIVVGVAILGRGERK